MENGTKSSIVEALILAAPEPLPGNKIAAVVDGLSPRGVGQAVAELNNRYMQSGSSFRIRELAGGYQFYIVPEYTGYVQELFKRQRKMRLTRAALETAAIVAYRQPVTKTEIEHIRGVASDGVLHTLLEKKLITITGRADKIGRPLQYGTTSEFLKFFGLARLDDLPKMSEIEEMLKESEDDSMQLQFDHVSLDAATQHKLNVADGTFDPRIRDEPEDEDDTPTDGSAAEHDEEDSDSADLEENSDSNASDEETPDREADADDRPSEENDVPLEISR